MAEAILTISSKNYSSWSLRGWLLCKLAELDFEERAVPIDDPDSRAELLCQSASAAYCHTIMEWPAMMPWTEEAKAEPAELEELDAEF